MISKIKKSKKVKFMTDELQKRSYGKILIHLKKKVKF